MTIVPAVEYRLLRFPGALLHGVPRLADVFMNPTHEVEQSPDYERMVLLFNTWPVVAEGRHLLRGRTIRNGTDDHIMTTNNKCHEISNWKEVDIQNFEPSEEEDVRNIQFPLMGDERRRGTSQYSAP